jgi:hypothetical protein
MEFESFPIITAEITFLRTEEGGRSTPPIFSDSTRYMPHIVIQDRFVRKAVIGADRVIREAYQGVAFIDGPNDLQLGKSGQFRLVLMYYPNNQYASVQSGATFTVREGAKIVAHGVVVDRADPIAG